jgi:hypothetical protein
MTLIRFAILIVATILNGDPSTPRVRSSHPYVRAMIDEARVRSATFRKLIETIEATDGIVYIEEGDCGHGLRACLPPVVTTAAGFRFLRVIVDARRADWQVMSDIGHELQHALEILNDPTARTDTRLFFLAMEGSYGLRDHVRETRDAVKTGDLVRKEVEAFANSTATKALERVASSQ